MIGIQVAERNGNLVIATTDMNFVISEVSGIVSSVSGSSLEHVIKAAPGNMLLSCAGGQVGGKKVLVLVYLSPSFSLAPSFSPWRMNSHLVSGLHASRYCIFL